MPINPIDFSQEVVIEGVLYRLTRDLFFYSWEFLPVAANATSSPTTVNIQADSYFLAVKGVAQMFQNVAGRTVIDNQDITVLVVDSGSGRQLMDKAVSLRNIFGHYQRPMIYDPPKLFSPNSVVTVTLTNASNQDTMVRASMVGHKLYKSTLGNAPTTPHPGSK